MFYYDKNGVKIQNEDIIYFEGIGYFKVLKTDKLILKNCQDNQYPHLIFNKIFFNSNIDAKIVNDKVDN